MAKNEKHDNTALAFATALLELAEEKGQADAIGGELAQLGEVFEAVPNFKLYLADPVIGDAERLAKINTVFGGQLSPLLQQFITVLNRRDKIGALPHVVTAYQHLLDEKNGKIEVDVTVAQRLDDAGLEQVRQKVSDMLKKNAVVHQYVDESIIGGMILRVRDTLIDASVKTQLATMKHKLLAAGSK